MILNVPVYDQVAIAFRPLVGVLGGSGGECWSTLLTSGPGNRGERRKRPGAHGALHVNAPSKLRPSSGLHLLKLLHLPVAPPGD